MAKLKILVVDDAVVARRVLTEALMSDEFEVATSSNGRLALDRLAQLKPDLVTLDVEMPELDGVATLKAIRKIHPNLPVVMVSSLTKRSAAITLDALAAGANDCIAKPAGQTNIDAAVAQMREDLLPKIRELCGIKAKPVAPAPAAPPKAAAPKLPAATGPIDVVAIGISTGGPNALSAMMPMLPKLPVPIVIVQHMPPVFTKLLAERLAAQCQFPVIEGTHGAPLKPGQAILAPGGSHMVVARENGNAVVHLNQEPPENSCRPAVDVLFRSVAAQYGRKTLAVIMTGMGSDGLKGCEPIAQQGGQIVVQDEATSVVWGMPGFVAKAGLAQKQLPLNEIAQEIERRVNNGRRMAA